jgi:gag-polyprotein putative aspartyl protease
MNEDRSRIRSYHYLIALLTLLNTACTAPKNTVTQAPVTQADPPAQVVAPTPQTIPQPISQNNEQLYQSALIKADSATAISQSAASKDDWVLVANNWQNAVEILKSIDPNSPQSNLADKILPEYEQQLAIARQKADNFVSKPAQNLANNSLPTSSSSLDIFTIPIQKKLGGVPLIEVTFNDNHQVQMLLDTGASNTLLTAAVATQLQLQPNGAAQAKTANGTVNFQVASVDKIRFGAGEVKNIRVAIGQNDLPYGLLGHDVYDGYDITIKESSIEFRKR